ncbi:MAG: phage tail protein, partial [Candidatus Thorarchaeota archaeon]
MVTLAALGAAASATGSFLLANMGTILSIAATAASIIFQPKPKIKDTVDEGPRLGDLTVQTSSYGHDIPIAFSSIRTAGNVIFATDIEEVKTQTITRGESGGKGGGGSAPKNTSVSYTYFGNFAVAFAEGVASENGLVRIWADGKKIYDHSTSSKKIRKYRELQIRFYPGSETQERDPFMEAADGAAKTPAYRGLCYIMFENFPLADFGNRLPNITAEISFDATDSFPVTVLGTYSLGNIASIAWDQAREAVYLLDGQFTGQLLRLDMNSGSITQTVDVDTFRTAPPATWQANTVVVDGQGNPYTKLNDPTANDDWIVKFDPHTLEILDRTTGQGAGMPDQTWNDVTPVELTWRSGLGRYLVGCSTRGVQMVNLNADLEEGISLQDSELLPPNNYSGLMAQTDKDGVVWICGSETAPSAQTATLWAVTITSPVPSVGFIDIETIDLTATFNQPNMMAYDPATHSLLIRGTTAFGASESKIIRYDIATRTVTWSIDSTGLPDTMVTDESKYLFKYSPYHGLLYVYHRTANLVRTIRVSDGEIVTTYDLDDWAEDFEEVFYHETSHSLIGHEATGNDIVQVWLDRVTTNQVDLDVVVNDLCSRGGLASADLDLTQLIAAAQTVRGYIITKAMTIRSALEPLGFAYFFDAIESDYKIKFVTRGGASVTTIPEIDLGAESDRRSDRADKLIEELPMEAELPNEVNIRYMLPDRDYPHAHEYEKRIRNPLPTQRTLEIKSADLPLVLEAIEARAIVETTLYQAWISGTGYLFKTLPTHLLLDPADAITAVKGNVTYPMRLMKVQLGAGNALDILAVSEDAVTYNYSGALTDSGQGFQSQDLVILGPSELILLDIPLLRDIDDPGQLVGIIYTTIGASSDDWRGAVIHKSPDGITFEQIDVAQGASPWGKLTTAMTAFTQWSTWDRTTTFTVNMIQGGASLSSATEIETLNGANACMVGNEIIKFANVTD